MQINRNTLKLGFSAWALLLGLSVMANTESLSGNKVYDKVSYIIGEVDFIGNWVYTVEGVSPEYSKGILHITKRDKVLGVEVALDGGRLRGDNVKIVHDALNFTGNVEGQVVTVKLTVEGNKINGVGSSSDGTFKLTGTKREES